MIVLASPQHPIKVQRIKYYEDPLFKEIVERQEGREFPYPPNVEGVSPWVETEGDEPEAEVKPREQAEHEVSVEDRNEARRARAMQVDAELGAEAA